MIRFLRLVAFAAVVLAGCPAAAQSTAAARPDSLLRVLRQATADSARVRVLLALSAAHTASRPEQAQIYARQALNLARRRQLPAWEVRALVGVGEALHAQRLMPQALHHYNRARQQAARQRLVPELMRSYRMIGRARVELGQPREALQAFRAALVLARHSRGADLAAVKAYNNVGFAHFQLGQYTEALQAYLAGIGLAEKHSEPVYVADHVLLLINLGALYGTQGNHQEAIRAMVRAQRQLRRAPNPKSEVCVLTNLGNFHLNQPQQDTAALRYFTASLQLLERQPGRAPSRDEASVLYGLGVLAGRRESYNRALAFLRRADKQGEQAGQDDIRVLVLLAMAGAYQAQLRYPAAQAAAQTALRISQKSTQQLNVARSYKMLAEINAAGGNYAEAYGYELRQQSLQDSLFNREKAQQLADLQTRYETQKKEAQISLLQRNTMLQRRARNLLVGGLAVAALLGAATYRRYRLERRARCLLQAKELELAARNQELTATQQQLHQSLDEKEVLLKEVHHRVKNNLQVIASRLALQALEQRANPAVTAALRDGQNWVKSISLIHEMLYQSEDLASVEFQPFLEQLVAQLTRAFAGGGAGAVTCTVQAPGVRLGPSTAVPLGLVVNELLSNAYKHAFADGRAGHVSICLAPEGPGYRLRVRDNGAGLPPGFSLDATASLGLRLVRSLARQLDGTLTASRVVPAGTEFSLTFQEIAEPAAAA